MSKRTVYTNITPLPPQITRQIAVNELHDHGMMIKLNPLVIGYEQTTPHNNAPADEYHCTWYEITDRVSYLPGVKGLVKYKACFFDRPIGLQTHCYAPTGLDIKGKWSVGGNMPGEPREARELGVDTPRDGLYLREEVDMRCNIMMTSFVKKNLKNAHKVLVERLLKKVEFVEEVHYQQSMSPSVRSSIVTPPMTPSMQSQAYLPQRSDGSVIDDTYKYGDKRASLPPGMQQQYPTYSPNDDPSRVAVAPPPPLYWQSPDQKGDWSVTHPSQRNSYQKPAARPLSFAAELPGSEVGIGRSAELYSPPPSSNLGGAPRPHQEKELMQGNILSKQ